MPNAVEIQSVRKTFGPKVAVDGLDLVVPAGSLCGFIGPNGAGKTTTIRMIMSIIFPDSGTIRVLGRDSAVESKDRIGYLPEERGVYRKMRVGAFLKHMARLKGAAGSAGDHGSMVRRWLDRVGLADVYRKRCEELSKGMQQKVQFIAAVIHDPELIILDEPFSGLDPVNMRLLRDLVRELHAAGKTILFSTHVMHQAEELCDHIFMIHNGRKVLDASLDEIRARHDPRSVLVQPASATDLNGNDWAQTARYLPGVREVRPVGGGGGAGRGGGGGAGGLLELSLYDEADPHETMKAALARMDAVRIELRRPTLEDVFIEIVQAEDATGRKSTEELRAALQSDAPPSPAVPRAAPSAESSPEEVAR